MADNAGIQLQVGLDLAYFRKEMQKVSNVASSEFTGQLNVKINRQALDRELNTVSALFRRRKYDLTVNDTTIKTARTNVQKLTNSLNLLTAKTHEIRVGIKGVGGKTPSQQVDELQSIFGRGKTGEAFGSGSVAAARAATARQGLIERLSKKSSSRGGYNIAGLEEVIRQLGGTPGGNRTALAKQATDLARQVDDALIDRVWTSVKDLQMNMKYSGGAGYGVGQSISKMINSMSLVSSDPKNARNILRSLPPKYITTELAGRASEQSMANMALGQTSAPVGSKFQNSFDKYLNALFGQAMADASIARQRYLERTNPLNTFGGGTVPPRSYFRFGQGPQLPGSPVLPALPPAGTTSNYGGGGGFVPPGGGGGGGGGRGGALAFPGGGMGPSSQLGAGYYAVGQGLQSIKQAYAGVKSFLDTKTLPLSGAMAELGGEFGNAIKQVLLYGTAYKALAFFTSLPGQAFEAAKGLATYRNQLQAVTAESKTFDQSLAFVDGLAQRFNVPLDSARQGFVKLYASMQPAGFGQGQIENLFTGISKAAAAFGLSADKVDRVNYAFAQMASKGQIMSEELKGQLGDVLPGALGLFAQAAQMSIPEFSKAMEDGAFKGKAMVQVLDNVAILMNSKFGPAAQGASKTLQGAVNQIQNNLKLMYESFTPVVNAFASVFGPQVNSLIKDVTSTMQVLTGTFVKTGEGFSALSPRAQFFYESIKALEPAVKQAGAAILDLGSRFATLLPAIVNAVSAAITFASSPLGRGALIATAAIATLSGALKLLEVTGIKAAVKAVYTFIGSLLQIPAATGVARAAIISLKLALTGLVVGGILLGLDLLIGKLLNIGNAANDSEKDLRGMKKALDEMAGVQDIEGTSKAFLSATSKLAAARAANQKAIQELKTARLAENLGDDPRAASAAITSAQLKVEKTYANVINAQKELQAAERSRDNAVALKERQDKETQGALQKIDLSSGDKETEKTQDKLANQQQQNAIDAANRQNALNKAITEGLMALDDQAFQHRLDLIDARNNYELAGLNSIEARQEKFQQDLQKIELQRIDTVRKAQQSAAKAAMEYSAAQNTAAAAQPGTPVTGQIDKSVLRNWLISQGFDRTTGDLTNKGHATPNHTLNAMDMGILGGSDAEALRKTAAMERKLRATGAFGSQLFGPISDPYGHGAGKGGQNIHLHIPTPGGKVKMTAGLASLMGQGGATNVAQRREARAGGKLAVEAEQASSQQEQAKQAIIFATNKALEERAALIKANINTIFPVAEQRLENDLMKMRNQLQMQGMPQEYIDYQEKVYKGAYEAAEFIKRQAEETDRYTVSRDALLKKQEEGIALTPKETENLRFYNDAIEQNNKSINDLTEAQKQYRIATLESTLASLKDADALKAQQDTINLINSSVESASNSYKGFLKEVAMGGDAAEALKKFQESLTDQVLTIFLDFAMKPVEDFFKEQFSAMFGVETEESVRQKTIAKLEEQLAEARKIAVATEQTAINTTPGANDTGFAVTGFSDESINTGFGNFSDANFENFKLSAESALSNIDFETAFQPAQKNIQAAMENLSLSMDTNAYSLSQSAVDYGANFKNVGDSAKKMAEDAGKAAEEADKNGEDFKESLGKAAAGIGIAASAIMGIAAGISQIKEGDTASILGGIGSIFLSVGGAIGGFGKLFGANGGVADGGWKPFPVSAFASGGMVTGPTLGLVGEGKYNEAIVPLPDGRSIPVKLKGSNDSSLREAMSQPFGSNGIPVLNMSFQSTTINGVEYVSRDQLEQAMAQTRRQASREGAQRGMSMTLDKLQQSPSTRSRVGIR